MLVVQRRLAGALVKPLAGIDLIVVWALLLVSRFAVAGLMFAGSQVRGLRGAPESLFWRSAAAPSFPWSSFSASRRFGCWRLLRFRSCSSISIGCPDRQFSCE